MKYKNIMIITLLIIIFTITAVSASEDNATDDTLTITEDVDDVKIESSENDVIEAGNGDDAVLGDPTDPGLAANVSNAEYGQEVYIRTTLAYDATGKVSLNVAGNSYEETISTGSAEFMIGGLNAGNYDAVISYAGDSNYNSAVLNVSFTVNKCTPILDLNVADIGYLGESLSVFLTITNSATGNITIMVADKEFTPNIESGSASLNLTGLDVGFYNLTATYNGDLNHNVVYDIRPIYIVERYSFGELELLIRNAVGTLTLDHDYTSDGYSISVTKPIAINGNGYKLDAKEASAIFDIDADNCIIANLTLCNVRNPIAESVYIRGSGCKIENCTIENITGGYAAIHLDKPAIINNVVFNNISTTADGGAIYILGSDCVIANSTFICCSGENGGCIYIGSLDCVIANSNFTGCSASSGGCIDVEGAYSHITNCVFSNSTSEGDGGAILYGIEGVLESSTFINTYSNASGGSICVGIGGMTISSCSFINSNASDGGAICWNGDDGLLINCKFTGCVVDNGGGGAISWDGLNGLVKNCIFYNCSASFSGGAIYWSGGNGAIENSTFINGHAYDGGAVYCIDASVSDCTFIRCSSSENGGAVYFEENSSSITNSIFIQNNASDGGAVWGVGNNVSYSQFIENNASDKGGAIYNCTYVNCNFTGNSNPEIYPQKETPINITASNIFVGQEATIIVSLPEDINSNITITVGGANYPPVDIKNGTAILYIANLTVGNYTVTVWFNGTAEYSSNSNSTYFTVSKNTPSIDAVPDKTEYYVGENVDLTVTFKSDVDAVTIVVCDINGTIVWQNNVTRISGEMHVNIPCTMAGSFTVQAIFKGDDNYLPRDFLENNFTVFKKPAIMNVTISDASVGDNVTVYLYLPDDATGIIDVYVAGKYYGNVGVVNGEASVLIPCTSVGTFELKASYRGDDKYEACNSSESFTILKGKFPISVTANDCIVGQNLIVNITIPYNINCTVNLRLIGNGGNENMSVPGYGPYTVDIINGKGSKIIYADKVGLFNVSVNFEANDNYQSSVNNTVKVRVNSSGIIIVPEKVNLTVNTVENTDEGYIQVTVPTDITKTLTLTINGNVYTINPGGRKIDLTYLNTGNYTYIINYPGDDKYKSYNSNGSIYLTKTTPELNITVKDATYGQGGNITVLISDEVTGAVNFTLLNEDDSLVDNQIVNVANGAAVYMIPELNVGKYKLNAQATGDSKYYKSSLYSASFNVAPKISITPDVIIGDDGIITMELGNVSGIIAVSVDGELDGSKRIADGKFIYALSTWVLLVGNHTLTFQYSGNSFDKNVFNYWDNETNTYKPIEYKFHIAPKQTETKSDSDNDNLLEIVLEDDKGNVLSNATGKIEFEIINQFTKEVQKVVVDVVNGIAVLDISQFKDGDYMITWNYLGDDKHTPIAKQLSLTITHKPSRIGATDLTILYTSIGRYSVTVYASSGEAMNNVPVTFLINNRIVKTVTTDSRGVASIPVSGNPGSYRITARADSISVTRTLTVNHLLSLKTVKVKSSAKKLVLTASLKKVNGKFLNGKKITFKFNGKAYSAKTNKKGVAKVTVKSNVLKKLKAGKKVTYQATYLKDTVKKSVKVKK